MDDDVSEWIRQIERKAESEAKLLFPLLPNTPSPPDPPVVSAADPDGADEGDALSVVCGRRTWIGGPHMPFAQPNPCWIA